MPRALRPTSPAEVPQPGSSTDLLAVPLLASDGFHELPTSPTVNAGTLDGRSGEVDIDGEPRVMEGTIDIGVDELTGSSVKFSCLPPVILLGSAVECTTTVTSAGLGTPTGGIHLLSGVGPTSAGVDCTLQAVNSGRAACTLSLTPKEAGDS